MAPEAKVKALVISEEDPFEAMYEGVEFVDDISWLHLDKTMAIKVRKVEMEFFKKMNVYSGRAEHAAGRIGRSDGMNWHREESGTAIQELRRLLAVPTRDISPGR